MIFPTATPQKDLPSSSVFHLSNLHRFVPIHTETSLPSPTQRAHHTAVNTRNSCQSSARKSRPISIQQQDFKPTVCILCIRPSTPSDFTRRSRCKHFVYHGNLVVLIQALAVNTPVFAPQPSFPSPYRVPVHRGSLHVFDRYHPRTKCFLPSQY